MRRGQPTEPPKAGQTGWSVIIFNPWVLSSQKVTKYPVLWSIAHVIIWPDITRFSIFLYFSLLALSKWNLYPPNDPNTLYELLFVLIQTPTLGTCPLNNWILTLVDFFLWIFTRIRHLLEHRESVTLKIFIWDSHSYFLKLTVQRASRIW